MRALRETALDALRASCLCGATGELIAVGDGDLEVHVYLQAGRIAWGTTTEARFVFRRHLLERCGVTEATLDAMLSLCQKRRRPLGESLVSSGIVTQQQVREGLHSQVRVSLESLTRCERTLFLKRGAGFFEYDPAFTFLFDESAP